MREESLIMIDLMACLEDKHVNYVVGKDENKKDIYEKFVHSLKLLEQLDSLLTNKHYVFKGGTSLLLLFESASRFSIDIDICMEESEFENKDVFWTAGYELEQVHPALVEILSFL